MTPDEHAAEAERILDVLLSGGLGPDNRGAELALAQAQVHALLATRPTPPAELTDGPQPLMTWIPNAPKVVVLGMTRDEFEAFAQTAVSEEYGGVPAGVDTALERIADHLYGGPAPTTETSPGWPENRCPRTGCERFHAGIPHVHPTTET